MGSRWVQGAAVAAVVSGASEPHKEVRQIALDHLVLDPSFQVREKLDFGRIKGMATAVESGVELPPIRVADVKGVLKVVDGWHRVAAHKAAGIREVRAVVWAMSDRAACAEAGLANLTHGLPLKSKEVRKAFNAFIADKRHRKPGGGVLSLRELAVAATGGMKSYGTVRTWLKEDHPRTFQESYQRDPDAGAGEGGPPRIPTPEEARRDAAHDALADVRDAALAMETPHGRGEVVEQLEAILKEIEARGVVRPDF